LQSPLPQILGWVALLLRIEMITIVD
jgi:hypothetical protein